MFDEPGLTIIRVAIRECTIEQKPLLEEVRGQIRSIAGQVRTIRPRSATSISLVASDGGNNKLVFDPFHVQLVRVVDSYGKVHCLDAVAPSTDTDVLSRRQFDQTGLPVTALGRMMRDLGVDRLSDLSHMIPSGETCRNDPSRVSKSWVLTYRDLCEWAVLYDRICNATFATDTLLVRDGLLRSKLFKKELFMEWRRRVDDAIRRVYRQDKRRVFLVGLAKHSKVLDRYALALALEGILPPGEARYVPVPRALEQSAYVWREWARGSELEGEGGEAPKFVAGSMYFVRFGGRQGDAIWPVDIFTSQVESAQEVFGYLMQDAKDGFPIPFYPLSLQKADGFAQVVDLDLDILQDQVMAAIRELVGAAHVDSLDRFRMTPDLTGRRYS
jgi:hypothetical protein